MSRDDPSAVCRCGHEREAHEHFRSGSDCSLCGLGECPRFRRGTGGLLARLRSLLSR